jgi:hypothetical protein
MLRRLLIGCFALVLAGLIAFAADVEYVTGIVHGISASSLTLDTGDTIAIPKSARYFSTMGKVRASDFEPGDHVTVEATHDAKGQYIARSITMNKKGTAEDKAEARKPLALQQSPAPPLSAPAPALAAVQPAAPPARIDDDVIGKARAAAFSYSKTLPSYTVKQVTNRYSTVPDSHKAYAWQALDVVTTDLVYENGQERYTNTMVNGKPTAYVEHTGSWSEGDFANMLLAVFSPATHAEFTDQKDVIIRDRPAWRYEYSVAQENSTWTLHANGKDVKPAYVGSVWIDKATYRVLRLEMAARGIEKDFSLDTAESSIDYGFVSIAGQEALLPVGSDGLSCTRNSTDCTRERTEYTTYRKFDASSHITFGDSKAR